MPLAERPVTDNPSAGPLALSREPAQDVRGHALPGGHHPAEEVPDLVAAAFRAFGETA
jgi:haloacetate dehalogenase